MSVFSTVGKSAISADGRVIAKTDMGNIHNLTRPESKVGEDKHSPTVLRKDTNILYILNGKIVRGKKSKKELAQLKPADVESLQVISPDQAIKVYGNKAAKGAVIIKTKPKK